MTVEELIAWLDKYQATIEANKADLSEMDTVIGDGDHGNNMARGMDAVKESLAQNPPADLVAGLKAVAMSLISKVGGASGPLYGTAFLEMGKAAKNDATFPEMIQAGADGIAKRGGAAIGNKTMLDVWIPVAKDLAANTLTADKIDRYVEATKPLQATKGRASYLGERSIGHIDPGAASSGMLFKDLLTVWGPNA